ncbi:splicing factor 3B subunit 2-like [Daphnia pulicaria]|uniref:splicing factor 3B subunit 2-like n=1 Tax=Daphnia pulicaria TaxID=35523 RepID=UPI001EEB450D|nr:splicing factor 3B subunit 2-like [Daphnia pulicaria]XP_046649730.1 splicing factor 3B subunit 2-like [Daphnia pulicaria]
MDHHMPPGYGQENYMYGDPPMSFQGNAVGMYGSGARPMSPPPGDEDIPTHEHLPSALEEVLAYKEYRVRETGHSGEVDNIINEIPVKTVIETEGTIEERKDDFGGEENIEEKTKTQRNQKKKKKKKRTKRHQQKEEEEENERNDDAEEPPQVDIEYVQEEIIYDDKNPFYRQFAKIFEAFKIIDEKTAKKAEEDEAKKKELQRSLELKKVPKFAEEEDLEEKKENADDDKPKVSKRKLKQLTRLSVADLKQCVARPDVVEMHDVTARDPKLLVLLKATRNSVPVPRHWCAKRKYLQGKRGIEKPPFNLPDFIKKTGIMEMRAALQEKEESKTLKAKMRERVRPKMGRVDIDYQKLHDAFFKWQTKPKMTIMGDLYYEGKEFETRMKDKKPGELSDELRTALGMPVGPSSNKIPPPWLIAMQRYGPPPSYPNLKIPGLNAPIPDGSSFGYHAGGWGKPPVDEFGRPLYGDVFGLTGIAGDTILLDEEVDRTLWGELESEEEEEEVEESEEEEGEDEEGAIDQSGLVTPAEGLATPSGFSSVPAGLETPDMIELRKKKIEAEMESNETPQLYTVLPEKRTDRIGQAMMGSTHVYDIASATTTQKSSGGVELSLDPSELEGLDSESMAARYEQTLREQQGNLAKEDFSDMVAEHAAKQKSKRKRQQQQTDTKQAKKYKEFKF